jgi:flagellar protein FliS
MGTNPFGGMLKEARMIHETAIRSYQKTNYETADIAQLVILCYEAVIRDLREASESHEHRNMDAAYKRIRHAQDVITELLVGLDYEQGGEIAANLGRLYNFMLRELIGINAHKDTRIYGDLVKIVDELRDAWSQIRKQRTTGHPAYTSQGSMMGVGSATGV